MANNMYKCNIYNNNSIKKVGDNYNSRSVIDRTSQSSVKVKVLVKKIEAILVG
jgi:hypothetical protein